jgi:glycolate oxidase FAD binding subunit
LSGPGRLRYGGVRDFLLGVRFVDGEGRLIRGGGRVVKNAAGFYLQHLLLGSLGTLGVLTEITCKVFPRPQARTTLVCDYETLGAALDTLARLRRSPFEVESAELVPPARLLLRLGGSRNALAARAANLSAWLQQAGGAASGAAADGAAAVTLHQIVDEDEERRCWHEARELTWAPAGVPLVKVATPLGRLGRLEEQLAKDNPARRYGAGGDIAWIAWPHARSKLDAILTDLALPGLVVIGQAEQLPDSARPVPGSALQPPGSGQLPGSAGQLPDSAGQRPGSALGPLSDRLVATFIDPYLGPRPDPTFLARVRRTLDPRGVFTGRHD